MYCKGHQIVNTYIYKYVRTGICKFRLLFVCTILKIKMYLFINLRYIIIDHILLKCIYK